MNFTTILALLANAGTIEGSVTAVVNNFDALVTAAEGALPQIKAFIATLEGDAAAQFGSVVTAFETLIGSVKTAKTDVTSTVSAVTTAVNSTASAPATVTGGAQAAAAPAAS